MSPREQDRAVHAAREGISELEHAVTHLREENERLQLVCDEYEAEIRELRAQIRVMEEEMGEDA